MLSEEEKKAIEFIKFYQQHCLKKEKENMKQYETVNDEEFVSKNLDTVLNLITKLQKENEEKDKQIDLIIEEYEYNDRINFKNFCEDELRKDSCIQDCKLCAKHYFEKLSKEKDI